MSKKKAKPKAAADDNLAKIVALQCDVIHLRSANAALLQRMEWCEGQTAQIRGRLNSIENHRPFWRLRNLLCFWRRR